MPKKSANQTTTQKNTPSNSIDVSSVIDRYEKLVQQSVQSLDKANAKISEMEAEIATLKAGREVKSSSNVLRNGVSTPHGQINQKSDISKLDTLDLPKFEGKGEFANIIFFRHSMKGNDIIEVKPVFRNIDEHGVESMPYKRPSGLFEQLVTFKREDNKNKLVGESLNSDGMETLIQAGVVTSPKYWNGRTTVTVKQPQRLERSLAKAGYKLSKMG